MTVHVVRQGECLALLAAKSGTTAKELYEHPNNAALKEKRSNPNVLAPGDEVFLPERSPAKRVSVPVEWKHKFYVKLPKVKLRLAVLSSRGRPHEGKPYVLVVGARELRGTTGAQGIIEVDVPASATSAQLRVWLDPNDPEPDIEHSLAIGHLDPIDHVSGVQGRLANLGYPCAVTGDIDAATLGAVRLFRERNALPAVDDPYAPRDEAADDPNDEPNDEPKASDVSAETTADDDVAVFDAYVAELIDDTLRAKLTELYEGR